ncbi:MAG TPA: PD-(D/E)XK nuclease family protein [Pirellulales bacterium]|nr:PD-(D/E)XK nuclease family protein [Pirellulales bacterium]
MPPNRLFLNWNRPALESAADYLRDAHAAAGQWPLDRLVVAFPGGRAGRRFLEILVEQAAAHSLALSPPQIVTVGNLPELLYERSQRIAGPLASQLAWAAALQEGDAEELQRVVPELPPRDEPARWLALANLCGQLHSELAAHALRFGDVAERGAAAGEFIERDRWLALASVQDAYLRRLHEAGLADLQFARLAAIERGDCRTDREIVLVGVADPNLALARMLEQVADRLTVLVSAPAALAERFDALGALVPEAWLDASIELADEQIVVVEGPADQAEAVGAAIAGYESRYSAEEITIGVPDARVAPHLEQRLEQFSLPCRYADGLPLRQSGPYRLLAAVADYLEGGAFADLAALVRHPDLEAWLDARLRSAAGGEEPAPSCLSNLDRYYSEHLQAKLTGRWLRGRRAAQGAAAVQTHIDQLLGDLGGRRPLGDWADRIARLLVEVYGRLALDRNHAGSRIILESCERLHAVMLEAVSLDVRLAGQWRAADALRLLLRQLEGDAIPPLPQHAAIELLGWLELPLDDAPALIVTGFNDGLTPSHVNADMFLPGALRRRLRLNDNDRRYARDAYALSVLAASRERLTLVAGRRTAESDPLSPSRLLFACDRPRIAERTLAFFGPAKPPARLAIPCSLPPGLAWSAFAVPRPQLLPQPITSMRVTEFRDYLACRYRYYLGRVLGLNSLNDAAEELGPEAFGSLAHEALQAFGADPDASRSTKAEEIQRRLDHALDRAAVDNYGQDRLAPVEVQIEQLRLRLHAFARWQARWAAQGWRIAHAEAVIDDGCAPLVVDGEPMFLRARIDRVDVNEHTGQAVIFDYKTSDRGKSPDETHRRKGDWVDLQLPLYRKLAAAFDLEGPVDLGYIVLPKSLDDVGEHLATWTEAELESADRRAADVIRGIRGQIFWPPESPPPAFSEMFARICQDAQFGGLAFGAEEEDA